MRRSRTRAVLYAVGCGTLLGCGAVFFFIVELLRHDVNAQAYGFWNTILTMVPGTLILGLLFSLPSALALVVTMAGLNRDVGNVLAPWKWAVGGAIVATPVAWLFGELLREPLFAVPSAHMLMFVFGAVSGLAARWGYRETDDGSLDRNAATTAS